MLEQLETVAFLCLLEFGGEPLDHRPLFGGWCPVRYVRLTDDRTRKLSRPVIESEIEHVNHGIENCLIHAQFPQFTGGST